MTEMLDMTRFIEAKSDQLNADDLIGTSKTITVTKVTGSDGDQPVSIHYEGDNGKPFKPCKTIRRVLVGVWGKNAVEYVGRSMTLYRDDRVQFGGLEVGGIRISHMSHMDEETTVVVMRSKGKKAGIKVFPLRTAPANEAFSLRAAAQAIADATTLDELKTVWSLKRMAPFREQLQGDLDARKAALSNHPVAGEEVPAANETASNNAGDAAAPAQETLAEKMAKVAASTKPDPEAVLAADQPTTPKRGPEVSA